MYLSILAELNTLHCYYADRLQKCIKLESAKIRIQFRPLYLWINFAGMADLFMDKRSENQLETNILQTVIHFKFKRMWCHTDAFYIIALEFNIAVDPVLTEYAATG